MKNFIPMLLLAVCFLWGHPADAQISLSCNTVVGSSCVGSCAPIGVINYTVGPLCNSRRVRLCVQTTNSSLCPSDAAFARVYVNGSFVAGGNITSVGSNIGFFAPCGSNVQVVVHTKVVNPRIVCIWQGNVDFVLKR